MRRADFVRWISAIAGALFVTIAIGANLAQALPDDEVPVTEEEVSETPDVDSLGDSATAAHVADAGVRTIVCLAGCLNQAGEVVFSETPRTPPMASTPRTVR